MAFTTDRVSCESCQTDTSRELKTLHSAVSFLWGRCRARALEVARSDSGYRKSYSLPGREFVTQLDVFHLHVSRAKQAFDSIWLALSVDGPIRSPCPEVTLRSLQTLLSPPSTLPAVVPPPSSEVCPPTTTRSTVQESLDGSQLTVDSAVSADAALEAYQDFVICLASLDLEDMMLPWIKETSAYCASRCFLQSETNEASLGPLRLKILPYVSSRFASLKMGELGPGAIRSTCRWLMAPRRTLSNSFGQRVLRIGENVLYVKRSCPPMLAHAIDAEVLKHEARVCRPVEFGPMSQAQTEVRDLTKAAISQIVSKIFRRKVFAPNEAYPTAHAALTNGRRNGGALGQLLDRYAGQFPSESSLLGFSRLFSMREGRVGRVVEIRSYASTQEAMSRFISDVSTAYGEHVKECKHEDYRIGTRPSAIPEPCKIRMITLGDALPYQRLFAVQRFLCKAVSSYSPFEFTGKPIGDFGAVLEPSEARERCSRGYSLLSGDFSAATDNLDPQLSEYVWERISQTVWIRDESGLCPLSLTPWVQLVRAGLTGHEVNYPKVAKKGKRISLQTWGQLMGSPVSFPILNIVNAATTVASLWLYYRSVGDPRCGYNAWEMMEEACVRTNGDDLFFVCPDDAYDLWKYTVTEAGLKPSLGKNYLSKEFCVMNSELRTLIPAYGPRCADGGQQPFAWRYESFCNLPILIGMEAKGQNAGKSVLPLLHWWDLEPLERQLVRGIDRSDPRFKDRLIAFERYHRQVLAAVPSGVAWHLPKELGGVGLLRHDVDEVFHESSLRRAAWLACLDPVKRAKSITPPAEEVLDFWTWLAKRAMRREEVTVLERVRQQTDLLLPAWQKLELQRSSGDAVLPSLIREYQDACVEANNLFVNSDGTIPLTLDDAIELCVRHGVSTDIIGATSLDFQGRGGCPGALDWTCQQVRLLFWWYLRHSTKTAQLKTAPYFSEELLVKRSHQRALWAVRKQQRRAMESSLSPMSQDTVDSWTTCSSLETVTATACYDRLVTL